MATYTRQSTFTDGDTIFASLLNNEYDQLVAAFNVSSGHTHDGTTTGDGGPISNLFSNTLTFGTNTNNDISVTFDATSNDGVFTWMEDEDYFQFSDDILLSTDEKLLFRDSAIYINSSVDGQLDLVADTEIQIAATTIDINGNTEISGNLTLGSSTAVSSVLDEDNMASDSATALATQQSIKAYVDAQVTVQDLDFSGDTGGAQSIDLDSQSLTVAGGTGIDTTGSAQTMTIAIDSTVATLTGSQTLTNKTLTTPVISSISNTGTLTLPTSTDTLVGKATTDTLTNKTLTSPVLNGTLSGTAFLDEDTMSSDSATAVASQQSIKAYVDAQVATANELSELTDVNITTPADASLLFYDTGTSKWIDNVVSGDITIADTGVAAISSGVIVNADVNASAAIDATKIHDGSISNTEFGYLNGVTSNIQTQLTSLDTLKAPLASPTFTGTVSAPTPTAGDSSTKVATTAFVTNAVALENELSEMNDVTITSVADADFLVYDSTSTKWENQSISGDVSITNTGVASINSGVIVNADVNASAAIDATKIHDGSVTNTEFGYIGGLTSDAQTQLNAKLENVVEDTTPQLGGDLDLNSSDVTGTGNVNITGTITSTGDITTSGVLNSIAPTRHSIRPSLNLDFANSKVLDPRITFTRGSNATYYDGYTSVKAEENLLSYSRFNTQTSIVGGSRTSTTETAPDGTSTASEITYDGTTTTHYYKTNTLSSNLPASTYTSSVFLKKGTERYMQVFQQISESRINVDLDTGTTADVGTIPLLEHGAIDVGNGWYRVYMVSNSANQRHIWTLPVTSMSSAYYESNSASGTTLFWGVQVEERDSLTAYTPTTSSPITKYQPALQTAGNNVPRFDHNPVTGESKGLLAEQGETNLSTYSEDVVNWYNTKAYSTLKSNVAIAPDGTLTADRVIKDNANANSYVGKNFSLTSGSSYTASVYVKKYQSSSSFNYVAITNESNSGNTAWFNLDTATVGTVRGTNASATITDVGNGWYRISYSWEQTSTGTKVIYHRISTADDTTVSTGNGYDGYLVWGFQLEAGAERMLTSYIKTEGSTVTRDSDDAIMYDIDTSDWLKQGKGTVYVETSYYDVNFFVTNLHFATLYQNRTGARFYVRYTAYDRVAFLLTDGTNNQTSTVSGANNSTLPNVNHKVAYSYATDKINFAVNGGAFTEDTTAKIGEFNIFYLTRSNSTSQKYNGHLKKIAYYPTNLTSNEIVDLTEE
jgi:hypothetical protein